jgi:hypothetical protein
MDTLLLAVTGISLLVAVASTAVTWRVVRADRQRRAARVAALAAAAGLDPQRRAAPVETTTDLPEVAGAMFGPPVADSGSGGRQHGLMAAAAAFAVIVVGSAAVLFVSARTPRSAHAEARPPLELVALSHARTDGQLAVTGLVRNPASGVAVPQVQAEVRVFDATGIMIVSRTSLVDLPALAPGQESTFTVTLGDAATAARYRVSFSSAGTMLSHVDRRTNLPAAVTADAR